LARIAPASVALSTLRTLKRTVLERGLRGRRRRRRGREGEGI
jgi:hypothetical protein